MATGATAMGPIAMFLTTDRRLMILEAKGGPGPVKNKNPRPKKK